MGIGVWLLCATSVCVCVYVRVSASVLVFCNARMRVSEFLFLLRSNRVSVRA